MSEGFDLQMEDIPHGRPDDDYDYKDEKKETSFKKASHRKNRTYYTRSKRIKSTLKLSKYKALKILKWREKINSFLK